jgi:diphthamide biosynthesis protein 4
LFHQIDLAYKVLKDPESRRAYDSQQFQNKSNIIIHDTVRSSDFKIDEENDIKYQTCKCGGLFILDEECLEEEYLIECNECSLVICVLQISTSNNNKSEIT